MKRRLSIGIVWLITFGAAGPLALAAEMPSLLMESGSGARAGLPAWVSLEEAFSADGTLRREYFTEGERWGIEEGLPSILNDPQIGCTLIEEWDLNRPDMSEFATPRKAARVAEAVGLFTVRDSAVGFQRGVPGTLFRAEALSRYRGFAELDGVYFFVPIAKYQVGDRKYCKVDRRYPELPTAGDEVLLMVPSKLDPQEMLVDLVYETNLIIFRQAKHEVALSTTTLQYEERLRTADRDSILAEVLAGVEQ